MPKLPEAETAQLPLHRRIAACILVMPGVDPDGSPDADTLAAVRAGVGALHSVVDMSASDAARYHASIRAEAQRAGVPAPLISGNLESGIGYSLGRTGTDLPYPRGIALADDPGLAYSTALLAAREARAVGYDWTFSPTVDVRTTDDDPILGVRAFGLGSEATADLGAAQVRGFRDGGMISCAKHFPGHGDSTVDSHLGLPVIDRDRASLDDVHLPPFAAAIAAGVQTVMVGHVVLPALGVEEPASLSAVVNREWLRNRLGFEGVIISDSLRMSAISARWTPAEAAVLALAAGADVANSKCEAGRLPELVNAVADAVADGRVAEAELTRSAARLAGLRDDLAHDRSRPGQAPLPTPGSLDRPLPWHDPARAGTVDVAGRIRPAAELLLIGDSLLAARLAEAAAARGAVVRHEEHEPSAERVAELASADGDRMLVPVLVPGTTVSVSERSAISAVIAAAASGPSAATVIVNGMMAAAGLASPHAAVVVAPAVDAFGICSAAAVEAVLDHLTGDGAASR
ncbi:glycoside hydrolase family 3 N-terminal domain-containing protein [Herbiconiux sp. A18JL235]|uniref:beta-N-acetylhexosaminidase n=1 Tax=Herbiconiux sp. A18JL235 TaxID=3152363 RepID=A0AB39BFM6_9MICO